MKKRWISLALILALLIAACSVFAAAADAQEEPAADTTESAAASEAPAGERTMYSKRKNTRCLKTLTPFERVMGHIMPTRSDAQVYYSDDIDCEILDEYIE